MGISTILKSIPTSTRYSERTQSLIAQIDSYLGMAEKKIDGSIVALLLPHSEDQYAGMVAAHGVKQIDGRSFSRVVLIGQSHGTAPMDGVSTPDVDFMETPLGCIELDRVFVSKLWECDNFVSHCPAHENGMPIGVPLLQRMLGKFKLVPIECGILDEASAMRVASTLLDHIDDNTLVVISSDFTHYGRAFDYVPFTDDIPENLSSLDMGAFSQIAGKNLGGFLDYMQKTGAPIGGSSAIAVLLAMLPESARVHLLEYGNSGSITGDWSVCSSYLSAAVTGQWQTPHAEGMPSNYGFDLPRSDRSVLLRLARHCIAKRLGRTESKLELRITPPMKRIAGAFVTLGINGRLRGCMGEIYPRRELYAAVAEQSVKAAFHDPHYPHLREDELTQIEIQISVLTAPRTIDSYTDINIGRHGIILSRKGCSAVFLPQVASRQGWGLEETLKRLAIKAGLNGNAWRYRCEFQVFEAIEFGERDATA